MKLKSMRRSVYYEIGRRSEMTPNQNDLDLTLRSSHQLTNNEFAEIMAIQNAAPEMLNLLKTIENDAKEVPEWLWVDIKAIIKKTERGKTL